MTGKSLRFAFAALMLAAAVSCSKDGLFSNGSKASIKVRSIDLTGAQGLMVMSVPEDAATKAGEDGAPQELVEKLFTVDENGNVSVAVFTFEADGIKRDRKWEEAECRLQLVPGTIDVLDNGLILLNQVYFSPIQLYNEQKDKVREALCEITNACSYILRPSDGALFPLNLYINSNDYSSISNSSTSADGKTVIFSKPWGMNYVGGTGEVVPFAALTDKGDEIELRYSDSPNFMELFFPQYGNEMPYVNYLNDDNIVFYGYDKDYSSVNGIWLLDSGLNPTYYEFSARAAAFISESHQDKPVDFRMPSTFVYERELYGMTFSSKQITAMDIECSIDLFRYDFENGVADIVPICSCPVDYYWEIDNMGFTFNWDFNFWYEPGRNNSFKILDDGFEFYDRGNTTITYNRTSNTLSYTCGFPEGFPPTRELYNQHGISYEVSDNLDRISRYDLSSFKRTEYAINWGSDGKAPFVSSECYIDQINGMCTVSGFTREATKMTYVIDLETGNVTSTGISEYTGSVVRSFVRLN